MEGRSNKAPRNTPSETTDRSVERVRKEVRGILSHTAEEQLAKAGIHPVEIPPRRKVPETPELDELRLESDAVLHLPETLDTQEAMMILKRGMLSLAWEQGGLDSMEVALVLFVRSKAKTRDGWIESAVQSLETRYRELKKNLSREEATERAARVVDGMLAAHARSRL